MKRVAAFANGHRNSMTAFGGGWDPNSIQIPTGRYTVGGLGAPGALAGQLPCIFAIESQTASPTAIRRIATLYRPPSANQYRRQLLETLIDLVAAPVVRQADACRARCRVGAAHECATVRIIDVELECVQGRQPEDAVALRPIGAQLGAQGEQRGVCIGDDEDGEASTDPDDRRHGAERRSDARAVF